MCADAVSDRLPADSPIRAPVDEMREVDRVMIEDLARAASVTRPGATRLPAALERNGRLRRDPTARSSSAPPG